MRDYYKPQGIVEEILVQKIVVETARYGRELALEQPAPGYNLTRVVHCLDRISRYSTATSRALYRAIEELERLRPHGKLARAVPFQRIRKRLRHLRKPTRSNSRNRGAKNALSDQRFGEARRRSREGRGGIEAGQESHVNGGSALHC